MRLPKSLIVLLAGGVVALYLLKQIFDHFTSVHELPSVVHHHPILATVLRTWPIGLAIIVAALVIIGFFRLVRYYLHWDATCPVRPWRRQS